MRVGNVEQDFQRQLGQQVRRLRTANGLTQGALAERLTRSGFPIYQSTVTKIEAGTRPTTAAEVSALARIFRLPAGALFDFSDDEDEAIAELARRAEHLTALAAEAARLTAELAELETERREVQAQWDDAYASLTVSQRAKQDRIIEAALRDPDPEDIQAYLDSESERDWDNYTGNDPKELG